MAILPGGQSRVRVKLLTSRTAAGTHIRRERAVFGFLWVAQWSCFPSVLRQHCKMALFCLIFHDLRVTLSTGVLRYCLFPASYNTKALVWDQFLDIRGGFFLKWRPDPLHMLNELPELIKTSVNLKVRLCCVDSIFYMNITQALLIKKLAMFTIPPLHRNGSIKIANFSWQMKTLNDFIKINLESRGKVETPIRSLSSMRYNIELHQETLFSSDDCTGWANTFMFFINFHGQNKPKKPLCICLITA